MAHCGPSYTPHMPSTLYTIGYQGAKLEQVVASLSAARVSVLVDTRETPMSRRVEFRQRALAAALNEVAESRGLSVLLDEESLPIRDEVSALSEILGIDALSMANEGKLLAIVANSAAEGALEAMHAHPLGKQAVVVGRIAARNGEPLVAMLTLTGGKRIVPRPAGEKLPRIC